MHSYQKVGLMQLNRSRSSSRTVDVEVFGTRWFLFGTNTGKERIAVSQLERVAADVLLPLIQLRVRRRGKLVQSVGPLFPGYLFAMFDFERDYGQVRFARGVRELVRCGPRPAVVPEWIVTQLKRRCAEGPLELTKPTLIPSERVVVVDGPFRDFEGIFERYISGKERVAVLLSAMNARAHAVLPAHMVVRLL
jgi:transcriptional antiterminator RfaH